MRTILSIFLASVTAFAASAQCSLPTLKKEIREAEKQKSAEAFLAYLQRLDSTATTTNDLCTRAIANERISSFYYERDAHKSIEYGEKAAKLYDDAGDRINAIFCRQNIAFIYDEQLHDYPAALKQALSSETEWERLNDTLQQANMLKYAAYLMAKVGSHGNAEKSLMRAINLYQAKGNASGLAVCYYDYGWLRYEQKKYLQAITTLLLSRHHWETEKNYGRIAGINNLIFRIYMEMDDLKNAVTIYNANLDVIDKPEVYWKDVLTFHQYSADYFNKIGQPAEAGKHNKEANALKAKLKKQGIKTD